MTHDPTRPNPGEAAPHSPGVAMPDAVTQRRTLLAGVAGVAAGALLTRGAQGGPLNPPPGPIASTGKTTQEIFDRVALGEPRIAINEANTPGDGTTVYRITQPGSYYLTGNITGQTSKQGIAIAASNVTIDLNGFALMGVPGSFFGIVNDNTQSSITIRNGSVIGWGAGGIVLSSGTNGGLIDGVIARGNQGTGISGGIGFVVRNCTARENASTGIFISNGSVVSGCAAFLNGSNGIGTANACTIVDCAAQANTNRGISAGVSSVVSRCAAVSNTGLGIHAQEGSLVSDCIARINAGNGIACTSDCLVRGNMCDSNGFGGDGAGILTDGNDNRIEDNNCTDNDRGIEVAAAGNLIVRNSCSGNTSNYEIAASNRYGPIINITPTGSAAVSGNAAASTVATTDPWANFAY